MTVAAQPSQVARPRLRGVSHQWAFFVSVGLGAALVLTAPPGRAMLAAAVYAGSVVALFATSALYHRAAWRSPSVRRWMRRLDHSAIFLLIAGSYTPFALLAIRGTLGSVVLIVIWSGALAGVALKLAWIDAPRWLVALIYVGLGWVALAAAPTLVSSLGAAAVAMVAAGGVLYTAGAVVYARQRPDPAPAVFGYHEVFHALVAVAAAMQFAAVAHVVVRA